MTTVRNDVSSPVQGSRHEEHYGLLWKLKATTESLLAANTTNVWSMYGGLNRLANQLDVILKHGLKSAQHFDDDYWSFVLGLRRIQPVLAPSLDQLSRRAEQEGRVKGLLWLQDSLENHTLSFQLQVLVSDSSHLREYYSDDAFLCSNAHFSALHTLLQAVEQNNARLLAQVDPNLLQKHLPHTGIHLSKTRPRSPGSPIPSSVRDIPSSVRVTPASPTLARQESMEPLPFSSPKGASILDTVEDQALGRSPSNVRRNSAKEALMAVLEGVPNGDLNNGSVVSDAGAKVPLNDPLLNRPAAPIAKESFQRSRILLRAESEPALMRSRVNMDENDNNFYGMKKVCDNGDRSGDGNHRSRRRTSSSLYWEEGEEQDMDAENMHGDQIQNRIIFTYDNSPSSSAHARTFESSMEDSTDGMQATNCNLSPEVPSSRTNNLLRSDSMSSGKQSLLNSSSEHLLFSEEEEDQIGFLGEVARQGRRGRAAHRRSNEDLVNESGSQAVKHKHLRHTRSKSDQVLNVKGGGLDQQRRDSVPISTFKPNNGTKQWTPEADGLSSSLPADPLSVRKSSGISSPSPACDGYFPQPSQGESLFTFLSSQDFATCPEVDKENAHFCISEAIIAAVEQIKCKQLSKQSPSDHESDASDEEIQQLKQRIRLRRSEKREQRMQSETDNHIPEIDSGFLPGDLQSPAEYSDSEESGEEAEDFAVTCETNLVAMKMEGLTASLGSLYSDAELKRANKMHPLETVIPIGKMDPSSNQLSAEAIALSLIKKFSFRQLPAASELEWLVSEKDAPQQLLPLPKSVPISPDDGENGDLYKNMRLRGNLEWAPPRPQIIFSIHPPPKRKQLVAKQNYRCAGCGMKVERGFLKRLRYCEYLGKYFCQCCHTNISSPIPSRILRKWDFSRYPVSNFSQELLSKIFSDPVFNVADINPILYRRVRQMQVVKELRTQLFYLKDFLKICRLCESLKAKFDRQPGHWMGQPDLFSLSDLIQVRSGDMEKILSQLVGDGVTHVNQCQLCQAKGFVCELCNKDQIIFPFQLNTTYQCPDCWACYHTVCFSKESHCPKCDRILARKSHYAAKRQLSEEEA
ncbi:run domain Beclin-1-interacting and cysteine-rich domain-containing protein-like [Diadema antillarum]|uniref:run domain Beclin-1-interacting and cysteine-rich domain-containing protein-like n=1 Tax=Diadema antillarum TaxID=105358 RepID=UPI003A87EBA0